MIMEKIMNFIDKKPAGQHAMLSLLCISLILLTGVLDYFIESINLFILYAFIVVFASLFLSTTDGLVCALLSAILNLFVNMKYLSNTNTFILTMNFIIDILLFLFISTLVVQLRKSMEKEKNLSRTDYLTGLLNRRSFMEQLSIKNGQYQNEYTVCYLDIDNFNTFLEEAGFSRADEMIKITARFIKSHYPQVFRFEENRFMIIFEEKDKQTAFSKMYNLRKELQEELNKKGIPVTFSVGIILVSRSGTKLSGILAALFKLVQEVKKEGGNQIKFGFIK